MDVENLLRRVGVEGCDAGEEIPGQVELGTRCKARLTVNLGSDGRVESGVVVFGSDDGGCGTEWG